MKFRKRPVLGAAVLVGILLVLPFALPLDRYIPDLERLASAQLRDTVKIGSLRLFFLPLPHLTVDGIEVGKKPYLQVQRVTITPSLTSLLSKQKVIREIGLNGVVIGQQMVGKASQWAAQSGGGGGPAPVRVERIEVRDANINLQDLRLRQVDLDLELTAEGGLAQAQLRADRERVRVVLVPQGRNFSVDLSARNWKLPAGPPLLLTSLDAKGTLNADGLSLPAIEGGLYNGTLAGKLAIGWKQGWTIDGNLELRQVEIQPIVAIYTKDTTISGRLTANPVVDMRAESASRLAEAIDVESDFKVENGVLYKVDLTAAPKALLNKDALKGGDTRFDDFSGHLLVDPAGYHLSDLKISSGVLKAEGELSISPKQELSGRIEASVKGASALVSTPLAISGTVQNPTLFPTKAALAGAAAGTALLGPGLGTTVGMKAFEFTERLFGKKKPAKKSDPPKTDQDKSDATKPGTGTQDNKTPLETSGRR